MIEIKNLVKTFHLGGTELVALKRLSFQIATGQFLAITGRSGAGKSTLLYNISLLDEPTSGEIRIDGENIADLDATRRATYRLNNFGFVFQEYALLPSLTALENVMLPMLMQGVEEDVAKKKALDALAKADLPDKPDHFPSQLSGGQQQRVAIARGIAHHPVILFADEPTANLDTESSERILDTFLKLNKSGLTIVMVTHEREYAALADRDIELRDGAIIRDTKQHTSKASAEKIR